MSVDHSLLEFLKNKRTTFANYQPIVIKLLLEKGVNENFSASIDEIKEKIILLNFDREDFQIKNAIDAVLPALENYILEKDGFVSLNEDSFSNDDIDECLTICNKEIAKRHVTKIMEDKNVTLVSDQSNETNPNLTGSTMTKAGRLAMELSHEKKRLKQELEELQTEYDEIKPTTPTGTTDWYVK